MNILRIRKFSDFDKVIKNKITLIGKQELFLEEIQENMWCLSFSHTMLKKITQKFLSKFWDRLIQAIREQCHQEHIQIPITVYLWFDELAGQLRFNTLSGRKKDLPFGCTLRFVNDMQEIFNDFLTSPYLAGIPWSEFEPLDNETDIQEIPFVLKVFRIHINCFDNSIDRA